MKSNPTIVFALAALLLIQVGFFSYKSSQQEARIDALQRELRGLKEPARNPDVIWKAPQQILLPELDPAYMGLPERIRGNLEMSSATKVVLNSTRVNHLRVALP